MARVNDNGKTHYTVYIYANEEPADRLREFRCPRCGRIVFRTNSTNIFLTNRFGANVSDLPPSSNLIEHMCHSCSALYTILFQ